tara:strand:- start:2295 stop:2882 length:588 start_codon:yes stop_codon:yes gene_type:complete
MPKLPIKIKPGALPVATEEVTQGVLGKLPEMNRRDMMRGALSTLGDLSLAGKVSDVLVPAVKAIPKLPENIFNIESLSSIYSKTIDNIANRIMEDPFEELGARGIKYKEIEVMDETANEIQKAAEGLAEYEAEDAVKTVFKGNSENLERYFKSGDADSLISEDYYDVIMDLKNNYNLSPGEVRQYLIKNDLYKTE